MPSRKYALEPGAEKRLEIAWRGMWKDTRVLLDGVEIAAIANRADLKSGSEFPLPDGSLLRVQLAQKLGSPELYVTRNGQPLPGSDSDPAQRVKVAADVVYLVGGLSLALGLAALAGAQYLARLGFGTQSAVAGVLFLVLGYFVQRRSMVALAASVTLLAVDTVLFVKFVMPSVPTPPVGGLLVRFFIFIAMVRGFTGIRDLKQAG